MVQQQARVEEEILRLGESWADAERREDSAALDRVLAPDFMAVGPRGFVLSKEQWLARYRSGDLHNESFAWMDVTARRYGSAAVLIGRQSSRGAHQGHPIGGDFRTTLLFVQQNGGWLMASAHLSEIVEQRG